MLYHYTDRLSLADIRRDGVLRTRPMTLYRDMFARGPSKRTPPVVNLTLNPVFEGTIIAKMQAAGWPRELVGDLCRVAIPDNHPGLLAWSDWAKCVEPEWWEWVIRTAAMARSYPEDWVMATEDIPASAWATTEVLERIAADNDTIWNPA